MFAKLFTVYATTNYAGTGHPEVAELEIMNKWNQIYFFDDK